MLDGVDHSRLFSLAFSPQEEIKIKSTTVFVDPYEEADAQVRRGKAHT